MWHITVLHFLLKHMHFLANFPSIRKQYIESQDKKRFETKRSWNSSWWTKTDYHEVSWLHHIASFFKFLRRIKLFDPNRKPHLWALLMHTTLKLSRCKLNLSCSHMTITLRRSWSVTKIAIKIQYITVNIKKIIRGNFKHKTINRRVALSSSTQLANGRIVTLLRT